MRDAEVYESGRVRMFCERGYGFVVNDNHSKPDAFIHARVLKQCGIDQIVPGDRVEFETEMSKRGPQITRLRLL